MKKALFTALILTVTALAMTAFADPAVVAGGAPGTNYSATTGNQLLITMPTVVALKLTGDSTGNDITFNPTVGDVYNAASGATTIPAATTGFQSIVAFTNDNLGANFSISASEVGSTTAAGTSDLSAVHLFDTATPFNGYSTTINAGAPATVFSNADLMMVLDGTQQPGSFTYDVTYTLTAN